MSGYAVLITFLLSDFVNNIDATSYASLSSVDGNFKLDWTYNNSKLIFKMTCKTTGWCAVGFTTTANGTKMVNYDIAVGGSASGAGYVNVSYIVLAIYLLTNAITEDVLAKLSPRTFKAQFLQHTAGRRLIYLRTSTFNLRTCDKPM